MKVVDHFTLPPDAVAPYTISVQNGATDGSGRVSSARVSLNGAALFTPPDFNQNTPSLTRATTLLASNTLEVTLESKPGSHLTISFNAARASLESVEPARGSQGQTLRVALRGRNTHWTAGPTRVSFGGEISVGGAAAGEHGPVTVTDDLNAFADISISATAALAPRAVQVTTDVPSEGRQQTVSLEAFVVGAGTPPGSSAAKVLTVAGRAGAPGFADGDAAQAQFREPSGVAVGPGDALYVADTGNNRVRVVRTSPGAGGSPVRQVSTLAGDAAPGFVDGAGAAARFNGPQGVAVAADGAVYVADTGNHCIRRVAPDGAVTTLAGNGTQGFADGQGGQARFDGPRGLAVDGAGNLYVADTGNSAVRLVTPGGEVRTLAGDGTVGPNDSPRARFDGVAGVAVDGENVYVYLADGGNHRIRRLDSGGAVFTVAGAERGFADGAAGQSRFAEPSGIAVDGSGELVVTDTINSLVRLVRPGLAAGGDPSAVTTLAGTGERGLTDGPGDAARLFTPRGVAVSPSSAVFVADTGNHVLRRILLPPSVASVSPPSARSSEEVLIRGERFDGLAPERNTVRFKRSAQAGGGETVARVISAARTELRVVVPSDAATGPVSVETEGGRATSPTDFEVIPPVPVITSFAPQSGTVGTPLIVTGTNLRLEMGDTTVTFAGGGGARVPAPITALSPTELRTAVPDGAVTGPIEVTTQGGSALSPTNFEVISRSPLVTDFTPKRGRVGASVTLVGTALKVNASEPTVTFTGSGDARVAAAVTASGENEARVTVPEGATTGPIVLTTIAGSATTRESFVVDVPQDYQLTVAPTAATAVQRGTATYGVHLTSEQATFTQMARLSAAGAPAGIRAVFDPPQITAGARSTLTLNLAGADLAPGSYGFTVRASAEVDGRELIRTAAVMLNVQPAGRTTLSGLVFSTDKEPIIGATVSLDGRTATTDAAGAFLLFDVTAGTHRPLMVDGRTASAPNRSYPAIIEPADIVAGQANAVPYTFYLPPIDTQYEVNVVPGRNTVAVNPRVADLQMTVPAGANLRNRDGSPVARISITPLAIDRVPAPLPSHVSAQLVYTSQPGGAVADVAMPVVYPNAGGLNPGTRVELFAFDHDLVRWYVYGYGRVSQDGRTIAPETDPATGRPYGLRDFSWHFPRRGPPPPPPECEGGAACCGAAGGRGGSSYGSNPVALSTGMKLERTTDISWGGARGGLELTRVYTSDLAQVCDGCPFGRGTTHNYAVRLTGSFNSGGAGRVVMPEEDQGRLFSYARTDADGALTFTTTETTNQIGDVLRKLADASFEYIYRDGRVMRFNPGGRLTAIVDRNGNATTLTYSGDDLTRISDAVGRSVTLDYSGPRVVKATDHAGRVWRYAYGGELLSSVTDPLGKVTGYGYAVGGRLVSVTDPRGNLVKQIAYDGSGRVVEQKFADGGVERYAYTLSGQIVTSTAVTDPLGRVTVRRFNASGYVIGQTDALGQGSQIERNLTNNLPLATTGPCGCPEDSRQYDARGNVVAITDRLGHTERFEYEPAFNLVTKRTDKLGRVTTYAYDPRGNLTSVTDALNRTTVYAYDSFGQLKSVTDPLGHTRRFEYDSHGNTKASVDELGHRTTFEHDALGRRTATADALGRRTLTTYDELGRVVSRTDASGAVTAFAYDANGNLSSATDALGRRWVYAYDARNRQTSVTDPLGRATSTSYNADDELVTQTSPSGRRTRFHYDPRGQLGAVTDPLGDTVSFTYDERGNLLTLTDERGKTTTFVYDELFRLAARRDPLGNLTSYSYDAAGNLTETIDRLGRRTTRTYDALDRPTRVTYADATVTFDYDAAGRRTRADDTQSGAVEWAYDEAGRLLSERTQNGVVGYAYNAAGQRVSLTAADRPPVNYTYDSAGRLQSITQGAEVFTYSYDALSRRAALHRPNGVATSYSYDEAGRLTRILHAARGGPVEDFNYTYNLDDEIESISSLAPHRLMPAAQTAATADAANRITQFGPSAFTFDLEGQTLSKSDAQGTTSFEWDARGRLVRATLPDGRPVSYNYDPLGRRINRSVGGTSVSFLYDGDDVVLDRAHDGSTTDYLNGDRIDDKLRQTSAAHGPLYFLQDHLGSTAALTDVGGNAVERAAYEPFGDSSNNSLTRYGFTGREHEATLELMYYRARWHDPQQGRFITEDPIGLSDGTNRYTYTQNNPINKTDPRGLQAIPLIPIQFPKPAYRTCSLSRDDRDVCFLVDEFPEPFHGQWIKVCVYQCVGSGEIFLLPVGLDTKCPPVFFLSNGP